MGALTHTYCDYAAGNDYKGATFTDGAYTSATKTLVKTGAFTASKVNHWLYLSSNSGGSIVTGYYKIATATDANTVVLATDAGAGSDATDTKCTQHDGTTSLPWRSVQGAYDLITRDATNGDQINIKAGTAQVFQAALTLATYGTPTAAAPTVIRGYTSTAGDGGIAEIDCNGVTFWASTYQHWILAELQIHNFGNNNGIVGATNGYYLFYKCQIHKGASSPSGKNLITLNNGAVIGCYIYDCGSGGRGILSEAGGRIIGNYIYNCPTGAAGSTMINNIFVDCDIAINANATMPCWIGNTIYSSSARTTGAIQAGASSLIINNFIEGYSGSGGRGIVNTTNDIMLLGFNGFYNNATNESLADVHIDLGNDATLAASPFTNAAGGDFSLSTAVSGAIDGAFPGAWYGPAATTDHADIGAVQNGAGVSNPPGWL